MRWQFVITSYSIHYTKLYEGTAIVTVLSALGSGSYEFGILDSNTFPYASSYQAPDVPGGSTATFTGLIPGVTYTFVVHDLTTNCYYFETAAAPIDSPSNLTSTLDVVNNVSCTGSADGTVSFTFDNYVITSYSIHYTKLYEWLYCFDY